MVKGQIYIHVKLLLSRIFRKRRKNLIPFVRILVLYVLSHIIAVCPKYLSKSVPQRKEIITKYKLCYNCFGPHRFNFYRIIKRCFKCGNKHHTSIRKAEKKPQSSTPLKTETSVDTGANNNCAKVLHSTATIRPFSCVLLATAQVFVISARRNKTKARALIDQGSEISLILERLVQRIQLIRKASSIHLVGIGAQRSNKIKGIVSFTLKSHFDEFIFMNLSVQLQHTFYQN